MAFTQTIETATGHAEKGASYSFARLWQRWKRVARRIADFQARLLLSVFYFLFFAPFALLVRWFSDPLLLKKNKPPEWGDPAVNAETHADRATRQF